MQYRHKIKSHRPKGSMCIACKMATMNCSGFDFVRMPAIGKDSDGIVIVKCSEFKRADVVAKTEYPIDLYMPYKKVSLEELREMYQ